MRYFLALVLCVSFLGLGACVHPDSTKGPATAKPQQHRQTERPYRDPTERLR